MNPVSLKITAIAAIVALILGIAGSWYVQGLRIDSIQSKHKLDIATMEVKVARAETAAANLRLDFETALKDKKEELDEKFEERVGTIDSAVSKLSDIRLHDPAANRDSGSSSDPGGSSSSDRPATGELSFETSRFLWSFAGDADVTRERLRVCKAWNEELEAQMTSYRREILDLQEQVKQF